ncbi:MAG: hypothetical protein OXQ92_13235, partial [Boseongicola sp.]|nr:hypothetical protein [Boseongicola sp.]
MITDADFDYATLLSSPSVTGGTTAMVDITPAGDPAPTFEFSYTPNIGFSGIETAEWQFTDGLDVGVIRVHVAVTDDPNFDWNVIETNPIEVPWQSGTRQFNALGGASSIEAFDLDIDSFVSVPGLTLIDAETGTFEFTPPDPDAFVAAGGTSFTYTAIDTAGNTATGSVSIVPQIVDLPPTGTAYTNGIGKYYFWESSAGHWKATAVEGHTFTVDAGAHDLTWVGPGDWISAISDGHVALDPPPPSGVGHLTVTAASLGDTKTKSLYATTSGAVGDVDTEILRRVDADSIGGVTVSKDLYHLESNDSIGTVVVSGDSQTIIAGTISENITTQGLYTLSVAGDISGNVSASDIGHTYISGFNDLGASYGHSGVNSQNGRISGDFSSGRHIGYVKAELNLDGDITASGNISEIRSRTADITSIITQSGDPTDAIHLIDADRHFTGEVVANQLVLLTAGLDISRPEVSNIGDSDIAAYVIGTVRAGRDIVEVDFDASNAIQLIQAGDWSTGTTGHFVSGSIETPVMERVLVNGTIGNPVTTIEIETITGSFGWMEAWESIQNVSITKGEAIRGISAGYWSGNEAPTGSIINSTFEARNVVGNVYAWHGSIDAVIDATEGDVRHVKAEGEIAGSIAAADSITAVESELGSITATLTADQHHISRVRAGDDLTGAITAT